MRNVVVSGASRGVGLAVASKLAAEGYRVIGLARNQSPEWDRAAEAGQSGPGELVFRSFDLDQVDDIPGLVRQVKETWGPVYGLINNAALGSSGALANMHLTQIERTVRLNVTSPMVLSKHLVGGMMSAGEGRIVNIASIIGFTGYSGLSVYGATKAAMIGFSRSLAREVGRFGVTVNAIAPGFMQTDMTQSLSEDQRRQVARRSALGRLAEVVDVANAVAFLIGEGGRNVTGTVMTVDAGNTA